MTNAASALRRMWDGLADEIGLSVADGDELGADLIRRYRERQRSYHGPAHVVAVLRHLLRLRVESVPTRLTAFFHDAIYDPNRHDNEARSAELAHAELTRVGIEPGVVDQVVAMTLATATHTLGEDDPTGTAGFLDADLAILGGTERAYDEYSFAIRAEYSHLSLADYREGRRRVLETFAARDHLYFTPQGRALFELRARSNIARELTYL